MRRITAVTVARSDFGIYVPIFRAIQSDAELHLSIVASGAHLTPTFGWTVNDISASGFDVADRVDMLLSSDTPEAIATSMGLGVMGFARSYTRLKPDILLVLGDRFEMHAAALAAVPLQIPIAHVHGGEVTVGAMDEAFRHAITKYAHLHFATTQEHAARIIQLGEEPWRVTMCGAPSLDNLNQLSWLSEQELERKLEMRLDVAPLLVTYHPVTLQHEQADWQITELLAALSESKLPIVITMPNADTNHGTVRQRIVDFARDKAHVRAVENLGTQAYFSLMRRARAMVGNSSSGIIEAASFELPVVNIGIRQMGRPRSRNILDVGNFRDEISAGIRRATSDDFRTSLRGLRNIYGTGEAAPRIVERLKSVTLGETILLKGFYDLQPGHQRPHPLAA